MLFSNVTRTKGSIKRHRETDFQFLNSCSWNSCDRVRNFLEECVEAYPAGQRDDLVLRLTNGSDADFSSAVFELAIYKALQSLGCFVEPHPELASSNRRPDFRVTEENGDSFLLEATTGTEKLSSKSSSSAIQESFLDILNQNPHRNFWIEVSFVNLASSQPSAKKLVRNLHSWLDSLNPDSLAQLFEGRELHRIPVYRYGEDDWVICVRPIPISPEFRGQSEGLIGIFPSKAGWIDSASPIRSAIRTKGHHYGNLDCPLVIAVNLISIAASDIDEMQALFGTEEFSWNTSPNSSTPEFSRRSDGAWNGPRGPQYTRVTAAWLFRGLRYSNLAHIGCTAIHNPWAPFELPRVLTNFDHRLSNGSQMPKIPGRTFGQVLGLPPDWPGIPGQ